MTDGAERATDRARLGRRHPLLRRVRSLRRDGAERRRHGLLLAEGLHLASEALACGATIRHAIYSPSLRASRAGRRVLDALRARVVPCAETTDELLRSLQDARTGQPIVCLVEHDEPNRPALERRLRAGAALVVVTHTVQDPGNVGAILRSADAAGADLLWVTGAGADPTHPRAVRASAGSIFRLPVARDDAPDVLRLLGQLGYARLAADPRGAATFDRANLCGPLALVFGGEAAGLPRELRPLLDGTLRVPMREGVDSLSVGAAAAVLLFEAARQRRATRPGDVPAG